MMNRISSVCIALSIAVLPAYIQAQAKLKEVNVYFMFLGTDGAHSDLLPLKRKVSATAPLVPAMEALLSDPSAEEQKKGYVSASYGAMKLVSAKINKGTARIDFSREIKPDYNPGDLQTLAFESAVTKTAKQFPGVRKVVVCVNGMNEFGVGMTVDAPIACPKIR